MKKYIVTLVGKGLARVGAKFVHGRAAETCRKCNLYRVCIGNLEEGRVYEVVNVRDKKHYCQLVKDYVYVVDVKEADIEANIKSSMAIEGAIITFKPIECNGCELSRFCNPVGLKDGDKCKILKIIEKVSCPKNIPLSKVLLRRITVPS